VQVELKEINIMGMDKTKAAQQESDAKLRTALEAGDTASVQLDPRINKQRDQVMRLGFGKGGSGRN
jgi:hypothetical protein